jgi:2-dehydro-3-deoxyphosphooctonate aldolase (KDO 8-P synthase)
MRHVTVTDEIAIGESEPLTIMCGPCVIEGEQECFEAAAQLKELFAKHEIGLIFKSSFDKANRSSIHSFRGPGLDEGLRILSRIGDELDLPLMTDVHAPEQAAPIAEVCDILQIPAFLARQTDLVVACAETGRVVHAKKGQFMAPWDMKQVVDKIRSTGNNRIILSDRGTTFGYNNLVTDLRAIPIMQGLGCPVSFDASHSVQLPGGLGDRTGGEREYVGLLAKGAVAAGAETLYIEAHPNPKEALSDAATMPSFEELDILLGELKELYELIQRQRSRTPCFAAG